MAETRTPIERLIEADQTKRVRIGVLGCSMEDVYVHGDLLPSQDGVMKFVERRRVSCPGGAAGAARQLCRWNANAMLLSLFKFGAGEAWNQIDVNLGLDCRRMPTKTRFLDPEGRIVFRHDDERGYGLDANGMQEARRLAMSAIKNMHFDAVLVSDYEKGFVDEELIRYTIRLCNHRSIPVVADCKRAREIYMGAICKANRDYHVSHTAPVLAAQYGYVWTHGPHRPVVNNDIDPRHDNPVRCLNHVGAGDAFAAHLALALAHGLPLEDAAAIAHSAGRVYVQHAHGRPPWPHELRRDHDPVGGKVVSRRTLSALRQSTPGRVVCFTNGCFDLFGPHHAYCLRKAREAGDVLVVAVNDDASVRRLKGPSRPVVPLEQRMAVLAALECVDWVVPFGEDSPVELLEALKPDVRVKGDFPDLNHAGDEHAKEVLLIPPMPGWSTTETCAKIRGTVVGA